MRRFFVVPLDAVFSRDIDIIDDTSNYTLVTLHKKYNYDTKESN